MACDACLLIDCCRYIHYSFKELREIGHGLSLILKVKWFALQSGEEVL